ncbi:hypothetical protein RQP53_00355 [Paucibacter sp. APW11]|uniref:4-oxalocrotonate tautomerase domain-containing protein n=1 Tax=Roseateles aquae TaxID=3077235 RepID=A0ABU3P569_9BURK|nr:hypothetical protein [Paucibacter sp. APW11]MDT8997719.1 hypothetical protein [Paucibacter sp. APW11]
MPTIHILHPYDGEQVATILQTVCANVSAVAGLPIDKVWAFWHPVNLAMARRPDWHAGQQCGPMVRMFCRRSHPQDKVHLIMERLRETLATALECGVSSVFIQVIRVNDEEVFNVS